MGTVLIVDDEVDLVGLVDFNLRQAGVQTRVAYSGAEALTQVEQQVPDLVVLDVMLPDISGLELCRRFKSAHRTQHVPIIMLTAKGEETDRVHGFEAGADDYVPKPFSVRELVLRAQAVMRRGARPTSEEAALVMGTLRLDPTTHRCFIDGQEVQLTALEFRLLLHLLKRRGRVQTREQLLTEVWGLSSTLETRTVDTHVMRLREKLGSARDFLETVRGVGYRLVENSE